MAVTDERAGQVEELTARLRAELDRADRRADVELAVALSAAVRIEPELVRQVRFRVLPHLDVGAESDFWFSEWVGARRPHVVALHPELLPVLRAELARLLLLGDRPGLRGLWDVLRAVHRGGSAVLLAEEQIAWRTCTGEDAEAGELVHGIVRAMVEDGRDALADWAVDAVRRLPDRVLRADAGWHLVTAAMRLRPGEIPVDRAAVEELVRDGRVESALAPAGLVGVHGVDAETASAGWRDDVVVLALGGAAPPGGAAVPLAPALPPLVEALLGDDHRGRWHLLSDRPTRIDPGGRRVRLRTLEGAVYDVPRPAARAAPLLVEVGARRTRLWLQPVGFPVDSRVRRGQPVALLQRVLEEVPADPETLDALCAWRDADRLRGIRLLHGRTETDRLRLATQFAAATERAGWQVYRGRQDPEVARVLAPAGSAAPGTGVLIVVDHAEAWHPEHLAALPDVLPTGTRLRVLALAERTGPWWHAVTRLVQAARGPGAAEPDALKLPDSASGRDTAETARRAVDVVGSLLGVPHRLVRPEQASASTDPERCAVAGALDALVTGAGEASDPGLRILRHEHLYRRARESADARGLPELVFLATLMAPLVHDDARRLCLRFGLVDEPAQWPALLGRYEGFYPDEQHYLDPFGPVGLSDVLVDALLVDGDTGFGVDPAWARRVVADLGADELPQAAVRNAFAVLARAARARLVLATRYLLPLVRNHPELLVNAGGGAVAAVAPHADQALLQLLLDALPPAGQRHIGLDPAAADLEERLVAQLLRQGFSGPERDAPLHLRLARSRSRAGWLEGALEEAQRARRDYERLVPVELRHYTADLCEALVLESGLLGELGRPSEALDRAEEAETRSRRLRDRARPGANAGTVLANLGKQKANAGRAPGAIRDAAEAVTILGGLADLRPGDFQPELTDALVSYADRCAEVDRPADAVQAARQAVELAGRLESSNEWAHVHRLATALLCLGAHRDSVTDTERAVTLFRKAATASPVRFEPALSAALTQHARQLLDAGEPEAALRAAEEAVHVGRPHTTAQPRAHAGDLARALFTTARVRASLGLSDAAATALDEFAALPPHPDARRLRPEVAALRARL
ncbi:hypothetical protein AB0I60_20475 [Actinosynnema sp. NPDC050436]|uniref:hypothetical protein n=1 Tax=Actinosynnema sp. NPDC050436 TaxID=3155659 RepID=UPI0033F5339E